MVVALYDQDPPDGLEVALKYLHVKFILDGLQNRAVFTTTIIYALGQLQSLCLIQRTCPVNDRMQLQKGKTSIVQCKPTNRCAS